MIKNIQVLRAFAAIVVVMYHAVGLVEDYGFSYSSYKFLTFNVGYWGSFGVDIFFIISGYIMFMIQDKKNKSPFEFAIDRIKRIVPLYWLYLLTISLLFYIFPDLFRALNITPEYLLTSLFFISHYFNYSYPVIYVGWTLELEMLFYFIFFILLFLKRIDAKIKILIMLLVFISLSFYQNTNPIIFEFIFGGFIYLFLSNFKIRNNNFFWIPIIFSIIFVSLLNKEFENFRLIFWGIPALIIFYSTLHIKEINNKIFLELGNASYSIYLIQVFTLPLVGKILAKYAANTHGILVFIIMVLFSIIIGYLSYLIIEKKLMSLSNKIVK